MTTPSYLAVNPKYLIAAAHGILGKVYRFRGAAVQMLNAYEQTLHFGRWHPDFWHFQVEPLASIVQAHTHLDRWEQAYQTFWQMLDKMGIPACESFRSGEDAVAALCHADKSDGRWLWEDIPGTMQRAQHLIRELEDHRLTLADLDQRRVLHAILLPAQVEYA